MKTIKFLLLAALMFTYTNSMYGQDKSHYMPKFAIKTNALYWATTTANLGFEVGLSKKLTLDVSGNYNPGNSRIINKSSTGWYSPNYVIGCANASMDISLASMPIMQKQISATSTF